MKYITVQHYNSIVESILKEKEKEAERRKLPFVGLSADELRREVDNHLGGTWTIKREDAVKFSKADINAVAGARFYRKTGLQLLMVMVIIILALSAGVRYIPNMIVLYYNLFYTLCGIIALVFIYIYSHKQAKVRKELWRQIGREESEEKK